MTVVINLFCSPVPAMGMGNPGLTLFLVNQAGGVSSLVWNWVGVEPTFWNYQISTDGGVTWTRFDAGLSGARTVNINDVLHLVEVYGTNVVDGIAVTSYSNIVNLNPPPAGDQFVDSAGNVFTDGSGNILKP